MSVLTPRKGVGQDTNNIGQDTKPESLKQPVLNTVDKSCHLEPKGFLGSQQKMMLIDWESN